MSDEDKNKPLSPVHDNDGMTSDQKAQKSGENKPVKKITEEDANAPQYPNAPMDPSAPMNPNNPMNPNAPDNPNNPHNANFPKK